MEIVWCQEGAVWCGQGAAILQLMIGPSPQLACDGCIVPPSMQCPAQLYRTHCQLYTVHCTFSHLHSTLYSTQRLLCAVYCSLYSIECCLCTVHCDSVVYPASMATLRESGLGWSLS